MKKTLFLLVLCLALSLTACGGTPAASSEKPADPVPELSEPPEDSSAPTEDQKPEEDPSEEDPSEESEEKPSEKPAQSDAQLPNFLETATLEETVLLDENGVKITATGLEYTGYSADLKLTIENNSDRDLTLISGSMGYNCNSINGYMVDDGYLNCDVAARKKANETISFACDGLLLYGINEIADIEVAFDISDADSDHTYIGPLQLRTSAFDAHDYNVNCYQAAITSDAVRNAYNYDIRYFTQDVSYEENGVMALSAGVMVNYDGDTALLLELENTGDSPVFLSTSDIAINGLVVTGSTWSIDSIGAGKHRIVDIVLSSILSSEYWDVYGIEDVGSVSLSLSQRNEDGNAVSEPTAITVAMPEAAGSFNPDGTEVYNNGGLRIVSKAVLEDSSEYSSDLHVLLLAENASDKTLSISDVYDSLSVNGIMTDYICDSLELTDGQSAMLEIELMGHSLEENGISTAAEVKEVEIGLEIGVGHNTVDEPVITMSFG